jgi:predicted NAD/FAD-binding protein
VSTLAIVGTGIAGLGCGHFLQDDFDLTLFEQNSYAGGHTNTVDAREPGTGRSVPIDTGFMVCNRVTYPNLMRLFQELGVQLKPAPMSFSVRHSDRDLEFCGSSLNHLFAQRRNLLRPSFWRLLRSINRFNQEAIEALDDPSVARLTLAEYVRLRRYGSDFLELYLIPMSSAVWSTPPDLMLTFPAATLLRFFHNHGFLGLHTQHPWLTVVGGSRSYVQKLTAPWRDRIHLGDPAVRVTRGREGVTVSTASGKSLTFDHLILACHADQALRLLSDPTPAETRVLGEFHYQPNLATLHTDDRVMPNSKLAWSSWNYEVSGSRSGKQVSAATHYWMNELQGVSDRENYFVTINPSAGIAPDKVLRTIAYEHPLFSLGAVRAQAELPSLNHNANGGTETYFAGSYFRYGFHEDALLSAVDLSRKLLARDPWPGKTSLRPE